MRSLKFIIINCLLILLPLSLYAQESPKKKIVIGFLEGGDYPDHSIFRTSFSDQLKLMLDDSLKLFLLPNGFKSSEWKRDQSKENARDLAANKALDLIVALGPWSVEDLLEANCKTPILAAYRFDPIAEGIVDSSFRPVVENLTVNIRRNRIEANFGAMKALFNAKRFGVLIFPSDKTPNSEIEYLQSLTDRLGVELITAEGYDNSGTFAFYKAYAKIKTKIDVLYLSPLWGFDLTKMNQFYQMTERDRIPTVTFEGYNHIERGALINASYKSVASEAHLMAWKAKQIIMGANPADLKVFHQTNGTILVNSGIASRLNLDLPDEIMDRASIVPATPTEDSVALTIGQAISEAKLQNPGFLALFDRISEAEAEASRAKSSYRPNVDLTARAVYGDDNSVHNSFDEIENSRYAAGLRLTQKIFSPETIRDIRLAVNNKELAEIAYSKAERDLELAVSEAFHRTSRAEFIVETRRSYLRALDEITEVAAMKETLGEIDYNELLRFQAERVRAKKLLKEALSDLEVEKALFNLLLNRAGDTGLYLNRDYFREDVLTREYLMLYPYYGSAKKEETINFFIRSALAQSTSLKHIDTELGRIKLRLAKNKSRYLPEIGFQANFDIVDELRETNDFKPANNQWSAGLLLHWPLFEGSDRPRQKKVLLASKGRVEYERDAQMLILIGKIRKQSQEMATTIGNMPYTEEALEHASSFAQAVKIEYFGSRKSYLEMVDAINLKIEFEIERIESRYQYRQSAARLFRLCEWSYEGQNYPASVLIITRLKDAGF